MCCHVPTYIYNALKKTSATELLSATNETCETSVLEGNTNKTKVKAVCDESLM